MIEKYYLLSYEPFGDVKNRLYCTGSAAPDARLNYIGRQKDGESSLADHGVRKYDYELGRFTSPDPLWEKYYAWTPYHYCGNNPMILKDDNGLWTAGTHGDMTQDAFQGKIPQNLLDQIIEGNEFIDKDQVNSYKHGMVSDKDIQAAGSYESAVEINKEKANEFINENLRDFYLNGNYKALGAALHTFQEQFAPTHKNWAIWDTNFFIDYLSQPLHVFGDIQLGNETEYQKAVDASKGFVEQALNNLNDYSFEFIEGGYYENVGNY